MLQIKRSTAIVKRTYPGQADQLSPYPTVSISVTRRKIDDVKDVRKCIFCWFYFTLCYPVPTVMII